jgi:hypothetical protein
MSGMSGAIPPFAICLHGMQMKSSIFREKIEISKNI